MSYIVMKKQENASPSTYVLNQKRIFWTVDCAYFIPNNILKILKIKKANELNIKRKLAEKIQKPEPLICIGYYLSDISFSGMHFDKSVNFSKTVFVGRFGLLRELSLQKLNFE